MIKAAIRLLLFTLAIACLSGEMFADGSFPRPTVPSPQSPK